MIELGRIRVDSNNAMIEARKKARILALKLGCTEMTATRIEAALSDTIRQLLGTMETIDFAISVKETETEVLNRNGISIVFDNLDSPVNLDFAAQYFEHFSFSQTEDEKFVFMIFLPFVTIDPNFSASLIDELKYAIECPSREELLKEIERKNTELASSRNFMESVLENLQAAVYVKDLNGHYTYINRHWEEATGLNRDDCIGRTSSEVFLSDGDAYDKNDLAVIQSQKKQVTEEYSLKNNQKRTYLSTKVPMKENGKTVGLCSISTDITQRKKMEEELFNAKKLAEEAAKSKSYFLANMSHEIRTPMNAILGMSYLIQKTGLSEKQQDYIEKIQQSGQNLLSIINDILDFSKIESGKLTVESIAFRLTQVLNNLCTCMSEKCRSKNLALVFDIAPDVPDELCGDPLRIGQILINYVSNAVKFTNQGKITVSIKKENPTSNGYHLKFEVQDTGIGLTEDHRWIPRFNPVPNSCEKRCIDLPETPFNQELDIQISGLDTELGLRHVLGKQKAYLNLLRKFAFDPKNTDLADMIHKAINQGDFTTAKRLVHTLKGITSSLGVVEINKNAEILETAIRVKSSGEEMLPLIENIDRPLRIMITSLQNQLPAQQRAIPINLSVTSRNALIAFLRELMQVIQTRKPKRCAEVIESHHELNWPDELKDEASELYQFVSKYQYKDAAQTLESLLLKLCEV